MKVDNAVILAAGTASRFAPLSYEKPKALAEVRGEILIERQIRQLKEAGIDEIVVVTGYKAEQFTYLEDRYGVMLVHNPDFLTRNNTSSIYAAKEYIRNSYICSSDNYFRDNPFGSTEEESFYSAVFAGGETSEWCIREENGWIRDVAVGGRDAWVMLGHVFWSESFSRTFLDILEREYDLPETVDKLWETVYLEHIGELPMRIRKYPGDFIFEFDTLDELREFDPSYKEHTRSAIMEHVAGILGCRQADMANIRAFKGGDNSAAGFTFEAGKKYRYYYKTQKLEEML